MAHAVGLLRTHPLLTPLLVVYAAAMLVISAFGIGPLVLVNVVFLAAYVALIRSATRRRSEADGNNRPASKPRDIALTTTVAFLQLAAVVVVWFVIIPAGFLPAVREDLRSAGVPLLIARKAADAALTVSLLLLPTVLLIALFRVGLREVGLVARGRDIGLGVLLAAIGVGLGAGGVAAGNDIGLFWQSASIPVTLGALLVQTFVNGLPEELAFRGIILGRLLPWLGRPGNSLAVSSAVFTAFHLPSLIARAPGHSLWVALVTAFAETGVAGLAFGYLYYRTRSIWPGVIWHTATGSVGVPFA